MTHRNLIFENRWLRAIILTGGLIALLSLAFGVDIHTTDSPPRTDDRFHLVTVVDGLEHPWGMAFLPTGDILVTERPGRLRLVRQGLLDPQPIAGLPAIAAHSQGGLLDVAIHPDYAQNGWVYLSYAAAGPGGIGTEVGRARLADHALVDWETLFVLAPKSDSGRHFGSRLVFDRTGHLYITLGDRGERHRAQDMADHAGSVVRLNEDGGIPADNPFVTRPDMRKEIFSYGHRNPQGAALHPLTGELWIHEHGPRGGDELNVVRAGNNYGWPVITYGAEYISGAAIGEGTRKEGMVQPLHYWDPSIAPSGMAFYTGSRFPDWRGDLFVGALKSQMLVRLELDGEQVVEEEWILEGTLGRIRDVRTGPDGFIYLLTDAPDGRLVRLEPGT